MADDADVKITKRPRLDRGEVHTATHGPERQDRAGQAMIGSDGERNAGKQDGVKISCQDDGTEKLGEESGIEVFGSPRLGDSEVKALFFMKR